jgi:hypothetical protein
MSFHALCCPLQLGLLMSGSKRMLFCVPVLAEAGKLLVSAEHKTPSGPATCPCREAAARDGVKLSEKREDVVLHG